MLAVPPLRVDANAYKQGVYLRRSCRRRCFVRHCSRAIRANSPLKTAFFTILLAIEVIGARAGGSGIGLLRCVHGSEQKKKKKRTSTRIIQD